MITLPPVAAWTLEKGDQVLIDGDPVEITEIRETDDVDEVLVVGYSHESGDRVEYPLFADDEYDLWGA